MGWPGMNSLTTGWNIAESNEGHVWKYQARAYKASSLLLSLPGPKWWSLPAGRPSASIETWAGSREIQGVEHEHFSFGTFSYTKSDWVILEIPLIKTPEFLQKEMNVTQSKLNRKGTSMQAQQKVWFWIKLCLDRPARLLVLGVNYSHLYFLSLYLPQKADSSKRLLWGE